MWSSPLVHSGLENTSIFGEKLPIQTAHHTFLKSRHPKVTKYVCYVLSTLQSQIPIILGSSLWKIYFNDDFIVAFCLALIEWKKA